MTKKEQIERLEELLLVVDTVMSDEDVQYTKEQIYKAIATIQACGCACMCGDCY